MEEKKAIEIAVYRDPAGNPTCAADWDAGHVCKFLRTSKFGFVEHCFFGEKGDDVIERDGDSVGWLRPIQACPLWPSSGRNCWQEAEFHALSSRAEKKLYHVTTPKKLNRYQASGKIISPVRGFTTLAAAQEWAARTGRSVVVEVVGHDCHKLPDHHQRSGEAWWIDHDVTEWREVLCRATLIEALAAQLIDLRDDRDSWMQQASDRVDDALQAFQERDAEHSQRMTLQHHAADMADALRMMTAERDALAARLAEIDPAEGCAA